MIERRSWAPQNTAASVIDDPHAGAQSNEVQRNDGELQIQVSNKCSIIEVTRSIR